MLLAARNSGTLEKFRRFGLTMLLRGMIVFSMIQVMGCTSNPYAFRTVDLNSDEDVKLFFMYGNFCGPGHPDLSDTDKSLQDFYPPKDDIDAVCYAHDYCFQLIEKGEANGITCDDALKSTFSHLKFSTDQCTKLLSEMSLAFFIKFWEKGEEPDHRMMGFMFSPGAVLGALFLSTGHYIGSASVDYPREGTCFARNIMNFEDIFMNFENNYEHGRLNQDRRVIRIEVPRGRKRH